MYNVQVVIMLRLAFYTYIFATNFKSSLLLLLLWIDRIKTEGKLFWQVMITKFKS